MTSLDMAQFLTMLTSLTAFIAAIASATAAILSAKNHHSIEKVRVNTNGLNQELLKANGDTRYAQGVRHGQDNPRRKPRKRPVKVNRKVKLK